MQRKPLSPENSLTRLQDLCVKSEYSVGELREKLWRWGVSAPESEKIISTLKANHFVNDARFARVYCRSKLIINKWGKRKILLGLMAKKVERSIAIEALNEIEDEEYRNILLTCMLSKAKKIKEGNTYQGRTALYRAMLAKGFESELISKILRNPQSQLWES